MNPFDPLTPRPEVAQIALANGSTPPGGYRALIRGRDVVKIMESIGFRGSHQYKPVNVPEHFDGE